MKGKISKAEQKMAMSFASGGGGGGSGKRTSSGGGRGNNWYIVDDPAKEATMKENYEAKLRHMESERDSMMAMWHSAMREKATALMEKAEEKKETELLRKGHQQMVDSMTEENRKLREKIAKLEAHVSGLEEALKLIGTTNVKENEDG